MQNYDVNPREAMDKCGYYLDKYAISVVLDQYENGWSSKNFFVQFFLTTILSFFLTKEESPLVARQSGASLLPFLAKILRSSE